MTQPNGFECDWNCNIEEQRNTKEIQLLFTLYCLKMLFLVILQKA